MTPMVAIWIASIVGAILFFFAGFTMAGRGATAPAGAGDGDGDGASLDDAKSESEQRITRLSNERLELKELVTKLETDLNASEAENTALKTQVTELEQALEQAQAEPESESEPASESPSESKPDAASPSGLHQDDDMFDDEATRVRLGTGAGSIEELLGSRDADSVATLLERLEKQVADDDTWKAATLADDLGMPVVGAGEYNDALAVFSRMLEQVDLRTRSLLPIRDLRRLTVEDMSGLVVSTCTHPERQLSLVTMTKHSTPSTASLLELLEQTVRML